MIPDPGSASKADMDFPFSHCVFSLMPALDVGQAPTCQWGNEGVE